jgi:hypothetical protein
MVIDSGSAATNVTILNSVMSNNNNLTSGLVIEGQYATVTVHKSVANSNGYGFITGAPATLILADSMAIGNSQAGILIGPSKVLSDGNNDINGNGTDVSGGTLTPVAKQ